MREKAKMTETEKSGNKKSVGTGRDRNIVIKNEREKQRKRETKRISTPIFFLLKMLYELQKKLSLI